MTMAATEQVEDPVREPPVAGPDQPSVAPAWSSAAQSSAEADLSGAPAVADLSGAPAEPDAPGVPAQRSGDARPAGGPRLAPREEMILAFERRWWRHAGAKEQAIRDTFGLSSTRYYQLLNGLLDHPGALAYDPVLVNRLRRLRASRARSRPL